MSDRLEDCINDQLPYAKYVDLKRLAKFIGVKTTGKRKEIALRVEIERRKTYVQTRSAVIKK